ncbi:hypothetical protein C8Q80DRAFT_1264978 [Daedaleopsis nitida]|nr:hypothetical protein C8Q80DRAFT_1264978 [Daedaleopsis nitida]
MSSSFAVPASPRGCPKPHLSEYPDAVQKSIALNAGLGSHEGRAHRRRAMPLELGRSRISRAEAQGSAPDEQA